MISFIDVKLKEKIYCTLIVGLTPMVEVALAQVEARCARGGQYHIAGLYHANRSIKDSSQVLIISSNQGPK